MKEKLKKISEIFKLIFGYSIMLTLFVGGLSTLGYVAALIIGGSAAEAICAFIYKKLFTVLMVFINCISKVNFLQTTL